MAYEIPERWTHGEFVTAAKLAKFKNGMDAIHGILGDYQINPYVNERRSQVHDFWFVHRHRWLIYRDAGHIEDPTGVGEQVTLAAPTSDFMVFDLAQVSWLYPGKLYNVEGVSWCFEDYEDTV